jgi:hypothetical protein
MRHPLQTLWFKIAGWDKNMLGNMLEDTIKFQWIFSELQRHELQEKGLVPA